MDNRIKKMNEQIVTYNYSNYGFGKRDNLWYKSKCRIVGETDKSYKIKLLEPTNRHNAGTELWCKKRYITGLLPVPRIPKVEYWNDK